MNAQLFGIENCDQCRKARQWLRSHGVDLQVHDLRSDGLTRQMLERWLTRVPWDSLLNRRGQSWRKLDESQRRAVVDRDTLIELLLAQPLLVKRPVLEAPDRLLIGFSEAAYASAFPDTAEAASTRASGA
ncbi:MAG TPA: arsenate reductase [Burkholderiaceae bacterium]|nr:arsenate reductase [Burkholderiaceae bacterium]